MAEEHPEVVEGGKRRKSSSTRRSKQIDRRDRSSRSKQISRREQFDGPLILELASIGTIKTHYESFGVDDQARANFFNVPCCATILAQVSSALNFLHNNKIAHRDMSNGNVFITNVAPLNVKIGDFGHSFMFNETGCLPEKCGGTRGFYPEYELIFKRTFK